MPITPALTLGPPGGYSKGRSPSPSKPSSEPEPTKPTHCGEHMWNGPGIGPRPPAADTWLSTPTTCWWPTPSKPTGTTLSANSATPKTTTTGPPPPPKPHSAKNTRSGSEHSSLTSRPVVRPGHPPAGDTEPCRLPAMERLDGSNSTSRVGTRRVGHVGLREGLPSRQVGVADPDLARDRAERRGAAEVRQASRRDVDRRLVRRSVQDLRCAGRARVGAQVQRLGETVDRQGQHRRAARGDCRREELLGRLGEVDLVDLERSAELNDPELTVNVPSSTGWQNRSPAARWSEPPAPPAGPRPLG